MDPKNQSPSSRAGDTDPSHAELVRQALDAAQRYGWSGGVCTHALGVLVAAVDYGHECVIEALRGIQIRCPAWPQACDYVRITQDGWEIGHWTAQEWRKEPQEVMGAVLDAAAPGSAISSAALSVKSLRSLQSVPVELDATHRPRSRA